MQEDLTSDRRARFLAVAIAGVVAVGVGLAAYALAALPGLEQDSVAQRFSQRGKRPAPEMLVVAVDEQTFEDLRLQWPFPRSRHAKLIDRLREAGARQIAYDVQFTEPTSDREDMALFEAVRRAGNVTLATTATDAQGRTNVFGGDDVVAQARATVGAANLPDSSAGMLQRFTAAHGGIATLAAAVARRDGHAPDASAFGRGGAWIDYRGPPGTIRTVSFSDVLEGRVDPRLIRGKVVVVGASAPSLQDVHPTPTDSRTQMSGAEVQANAIWSALHGLPLRDTPWWADMLAIIALGLLPVLMALRRRALAVALIAPVAAAAWIVAAQVAFDRGWMVALIYPLIALALGTVGTIAAAYVVERHEKRRVTQLNHMLEGIVRERTGELRTTQFEVIERLAHAAESRDGETGAHIQRIGRLTERLGLALGMSATDAETLRYASALHDIGKIGIPDEVLNKPGRLSAHERTIIERHTLIGSEVLAESQSPVVRLAEVIARTHHERWDGAGYPAGLRGEEIPLAGRITAVCDVFDALLSHRRYKQAWPLEDALAELRRERGRQFDAAIVDAFLALVPGLEQDLLQPSQTPGLALVEDL